MTEFVDPKLGVIACTHVAAAERPVLLATHYEDGDWAFTCGMADHADDDYAWIEIGQLLPAGDELDDVSDLPLGWSAERQSVDEDWMSYEDEDGDEAEAGDEPEA